METGKPDAATHYACRDIAAERDALRAEVDKLNIDKLGLIAKNERILRELEYDQRNAAMSQEESAQILAENERLAKCCTQRGARMQIMRDWLAYPSQPSDGWERFVTANPSAGQWFDSDGVPVGA
jgi:hypothetical protein